MIQQSAISKSNQNRITFSDYFPNRSRYFTVFIHHFENTPIVYDTLAEVLELIIIFLKRNTNADKFQLQNFFNDMNWIVSGKLNSLPIAKQGISLGLTLVNENKITALQYGRILLGQIKNTKFEQIGSSWENFSIKALEDLSLLGLTSEDKYPEIYEIDLQDSDKFLTIESELVPIFNHFKADKSEFKPETNCFQLLTCRRNLKKRRIFRESKRI